MQILRNLQKGMLCTALTVLVFSHVSGQATQSAIGQELRQLYDFDLLPEYRTNSKVYLISTYDTTGGNDDGFSGKYSFVRKEGDHLVLADLKGPGVVHRIHTPTPTDKMLAFYFDGEETPRLRVPFIELFSGNIKPFLKPLVGNEVGGYYCYFPIPYQKSLKIVYEGTDARFHQIQYRSYLPGTNISSFTTSLTPEETAAFEKAALTWNQSGKPYWTTGGQRPSIKKAEKKFTLQPGKSVNLFKYNKGARIVGIEIDRNSVKWGPDVLLEARWDGEAKPAVYCPADDFFGYFFGKVATQSLLVGSSEGHDYCYFPMPFDRSATIALKTRAGLDQQVTGTVRIYYEDVPRRKQEEGKLYTVWRREHDPEKGKPYLLFEAEGRGHQVATLLQSQGLEAGTTIFFEGDDVKTIDGEDRWHGGGSEDYFNGGWYWILDRWDRAVSLPVHGCLDYSLPFARTGGYRLYLSDKVPFEKKYHFTIEHGHEGNLHPVDYTSMIFYYGEQSSPSAMDPAQPSKPVPIPEIHEYDVRDFVMTIGAGTTAQFKGYSSGMDISGFIPIRGFVVDDADRGEAKGQARIEFSEMPSGRYRLYITYDEGDHGGEFSIWRRQQQVSDWKSTYADSIKRINRYSLGEVEFTDQIKTLTIRTRAGSNGKAVLRIRKLALERIRQ